MSDYEPGQAWQAVEPASDQLQQALDRGGMANWADGKVIREAARVHAFMFTTCDTCGGNWQSQGYPPLPCPDCVDGKVPSQEAAYVLAEAITWHGETKSNHEVAEAGLLAVLAAAKEVSDSE